MKEMNNDLLQRYVEGNVTREEIKTVVDWLDADENNLKEYKALHKLYYLSLFQTPALRQPSAKQRLWAGMRKPAYECLKIAAIFLLAWAGLQFLAHYPGEEQPPAAYHTLFVPAGQRAELTLPDSSKVWLNAQSTLTYPSHFEKGDRLVELDGEAYFTVKHKEEQPFIVQTKQMDIKVLGTEFSVIAYGARPIFEVSLLKGSVELRPLHSNQTYIMQLNERVRLENNKLTVSSISDYDYFRWREGLICFNNETVGNIFEKLELYFDTNIEVEKTSILTHRYSGKFRTKDGVEQVLKVLQLEQRFSYTKDNDQNIITIQ
ncbi:MAG: FecR domain-containing protein [Tannerellaceae bacterium]|jgi:ferric-dicitrate binding protein FerR (iron transport regulator)|nr:FecR domain-containing protein [Tannerellaceae bacterium]